MRQCRGAIGRIESAIEKRVKIADPTFGDAPLDDIQSANNSLKKVIEVVSDAARQLPDRLHLLALAQRFLGLHQLAGAFGHALLEGRVDVGQRLCGDLLILDVGVTADPPYAGVGAAAGRKRASKMPTIRVVRASDAKLRFVGRAGRQSGPPKFRDGSTSRRGARGAPSLAVQCFWSRATVFVYPIVEPIELTVRTRCPDMIGHRLRQSAKLRFACPQDFLSDASFVHVAKDRGNKNARLARPAR